MESLTAALNEDKTFNKVVQFKRILVIGSKGVGKTSIVAGFAKGFLLGDI